MEWQFSSCSSIGVHYDKYTKYIHRCCLNPGNYTLICRNKEKPHGWNDGYIEIQGHRYCDDFLSYRVMQKISLQGNISIKIIFDIFNLFSLNHFFHIVACYAFSFLSDRISRHPQQLVKKLSVGTN